MGLLDGKRIVVVGGTSGLGLSAAAAFVREGARLVAVGLDDSARAQGVLGGAGWVFTADARDPATAEEAVSACVQRHGGVDGLYHVAGGSGRKMGDGFLHEMTEEGWRATLDLNLNSVAWSNRAVIRGFLRQGTGGAILNLSSVLGYSPSPGHFGTHAYATAKAGVIGLSVSLAAAYARDGIRVNVLAPGLVDTPMARRAVGDPEIQAFIRTKQPLDGGRVGFAADLEAAAVFLMSDGARFVTGQTLAVDGGWGVSEGQRSVGGSTS
jgi:NAD(P)-dependent dehydrogenase (short-subunit alcohol dehydrogenase family)